MGYQLFMNVSEDIILFTSTEKPYLVLTPNIPDSEADVFVFDSLNVKPCK